MGKVERLIIYTLLAVMAAATFSNRGLIQAKDKPGEGTFTKLTIVDEKGTARMQLASGVEGYQLRIYSPDGIVSAAFTPGAVEFLREDGRISAFFSADGLKLSGKIGEPPAPFLRFLGRIDGLSAILRPSSVMFYDEYGKLRAALNVTKGASGLVLLDEKGEQRAVLDVSKDGPGLELYDDEGKTRAVLGSASLKTTATGAVITRSPSSLVLFDKEGKIIWRTPQD